MSQLIAGKISVALDLWIVRYRLKNMTCSVDYVRKSFKIGIL